MKVLFYLLPLTFLLFSSAQKYSRRQFKVYLFFLFTLLKDAITLNGMLTETSWSVEKLYLLFNKDAARSSSSNTPTAGFQAAGIYT